MTHTQLLVNKTDLSRSQLQSADDTPLAGGQVRVAVDRFAFTSNNITYAAFGDAMHYWNFFPSDQEGWGIVPVWGFADVVQSGHPGVAVGERLYGYYPMGEQLVLQPDRLSPQGFSDASPHRAALHAVYNRYQRCTGDPFYSAESQDLQALLRPLFTTSWLIDDFLADNYEQLDQLAADTPCIYVDFAGNASLRLAVHTRFAQLAYSCSIGGTHVAQLGGARNLPGPKATLFFAPAQIRKRHAEWGAEGLAERLVTGWRAFLARVSDPQSPWLVVQQHRGPVETQALYQQVLAGKTDPRSGHMGSMRP